MRTGLLMVTMLSLVLGGCSARTDRPEPQAAELPAVAAVSPEGVPQPAPEAQALDLEAMRRQGLTFYWSMESETPDLYPAGSDATPYYYPVQPTLRTTDQARSGKYSLDLSGQSWRQATFDNPSNEMVWAPTDEGAIVLWWKYTGTLNAGMLMQITGKCKTDKALDTNDGRSIRFHGDTEIRFGPAWYKHGRPFEADRWYKVTARWQTKAEPHFWLQIDDRPAVTSNRAPTPTECKAWHHLLWGNDTRSVPPGLYLDDVQVWSRYDIPVSQ